MGLCETALVNVAVRITLMSVGQTFAIQAFLLLKDDVTCVLDVKLLYRHFYGDVLAKQGPGVEATLSEMFSKNENKQCKKPLDSIKSHKYCDVAPETDFDENSIVVSYHSC
jgi:hypothetical protein